MNFLTSYASGIADTFFSVCGSMWMGLRTFSRPNVTTEYPRKEKWDVPDGSRMKLYNNIDDCIGCYKCSRICPTDCIEIETIKAPDEVDLGKASTGNPLNFWLPKFDIDMVKCCYCDLCTTVCPTECLVMTKAYEGSAYDRGNLVYHFGNVDSQEMEEINALLEDDEEEAGAGATDTAEEEGAAGTTGKIDPDSLETLDLRDRIRARLINRGKMEGELPEGVEVIETTTTETTTETAPADGNGASQTAAGSDESAEAEVTDTATETEEEVPEEDETSAEDAGSSGDDYVRDEDKPLRERIEERLKSHGKL